MPRRTQAVLLALLCSSAADARTPECDAVALEARAIERAWLAAYESRGTTKMAGVLAPGFTITHPDASVQSRKDVLEALGRRRGTPGPRFFTTGTQAACAGDVVVLTGWVAQEGREQSRARYTDTYIRSGRTWQVLASHLSRPKPAAVPPPTAPPPNPGPPGPSSPARAGGDEP